MLKIFVFIHLKQRQRYLSRPNLKFRLSKFIDDFSLPSFFFYMTRYEKLSFMDDFSFQSFFLFFLFNDTRHNTRRSVNVSFEARSQQNCYCVWQVLNGLAVSQQTTGICNVQTTTSSLGFSFERRKVVRDFPFHGARLLSFTTRHVRSPKED